MLGFKWEVVNVVHVIWSQIWWRNMTALNETDISCVTLKIAQKAIKKVLLRYTVTFTL